MKFLAKVPTELWIRLLRDVRDILGCIVGEDQ